MMQATKKGDARLGRGVWVEMQRRVQLVTSAAPLQGSTRVVPLWVWSIKSILISHDDTAGTGLATSHVPSVPGKIHDPSSNSYKGSSEQAAVYITFAARGRGRDGKRRGWQGDWNHQPPAGDAILWLLKRKQRASSRINWGWVGRWVGGPFHSL